MLLSLLKNLLNLQKEFAGNESEKLIRGVNY